MKHMASETLHRKVDNFTLKMIKPKLDVLNVIETCSSKTVRGLKKHRGFSSIK